MDDDYPRPEDNAVVMTIDQLIRKILKKIPNELMPYRYSQKKPLTDRQMTLLPPSIDYYINQEGFENYIEELIYFLYETVHKYTTPFFYNKILSLCMLMPVLIKEIKDVQFSLAVFSDAGDYFNNALNKVVTNEYYCWLSVMFIFEETSPRMEKEINELSKINIEAAEMKKKELNDLYLLYYEAGTRLHQELSIISVKNVLKDVVATPKDIYVHNGRGYTLPFFDSYGSAMLIEFFGNKGTGKTFNFIKCIEVALYLGFTIILVGEDRGELRYAYYQCTLKSNRIQYNRLMNQKQEPKGLPMTIYCDNPKYKMEKDIFSFQGTIDDWQNMQGVVLFEFNQEYKEAEEIKRQIKNIERIIKSLKDYRENDRSKKIMIGMNEAQKMVGTEVKKYGWEVGHLISMLSTDLRGLGIPIILNTHYLSRVKEDIHQPDIIFSSKVSSFDERSKIARLCGIRQLAGLLANDKLKTNREFYMIKDNAYQLVKFLAPACMLENKYYTLEKLDKDGV